ncbi:hypothetical protein QNI22_02480 [Cytophagaceae bacterium BD1B2-1]|uniref:Transposase IS4-like domain-containing protein n=1 Tax=Xanthocytophaga agilis TaxID=3048010 RepID=A0AAE3QWW7_9BACT|nr:hypothetical protein [Xanthocytophaga agilis]MDJ1499491.1 hypothetical protein [Xanthocytophaga agilis]
MTNRVKHKRVGKHYGKRWKIEYCFKHLKANGFNLEQVAFKDTHKISLLITFVIVVYIQAIQQGILQQKKEPVGQIRYANGNTYRAVSVGLYRVKEKLLSLVNFRSYLVELVPKNNLI